MRHNLHVMLDKDDLARFRRFFPAHGATSRVTRALIRWYLEKAEAEFAARSGEELAPSKRLRDFIEEEIRGTSKPAE